MLFIPRTIPKFYGIIWVIVEECMKFFGYCNCLLLMWMHEGINVFLATWIVFMMTMMQETSCVWTAWLIPHLMVNDSASVGVMSTTWWSIFFKGLLKEWIWVIEVATLFLILASVIMITDFGSDNNSRMILSSFLKWAALILLELQSALWKEMWLEKMSISL